MRVRPAVPGDGAALLVLTRQCPMQAAVSLAIEREPDFFALSRARGCARTLVAEADGRLVACGGIARRPAWVDGRTAEVAYLADVKVAPAYRRAGLGARLVDALLADDAGAPPVPLLATVAAGNRPVDRLAARYADGGRLIETIDVRCLQLFAARPPRGTSLDVGRARPEDGPQLVALLDAFHRDRQFAPVFGDGGLGQILSRSPGLELRDYFVARRGGRVVASVALWDQAGFKRVRVLRVTPALRLGLRAMAMAARVLPVPVVPPTGQLLRLAFLRHPAHAPGEERALASLLRTVTREAAAAGHHFSVLTVPQGDPVGRCARGIPRLEYRYRLLVGASAPLPDPPSLVARVVFDDAALS